MRKRIGYPSDKEYYTPELGEISLGDEIYIYSVEADVLNKWIVVPEILGYLQRTYEIHDQSGKVYFKYLTRKDIANVEGVHELYVIDMFDDDKIVSGFEYDKNISIIYDEEQHMLKMYKTDIINEFSGNWVVRSCFWGKCYNKNEFKQILKLIK